MWSVHCRSPHFADSSLTLFFQRSDDSLILWSYAVEHIIPLCQEFEEKLIKYIWRTRGAPKRESNAPLPAGSPFGTPVSSPRIASFVASSSNLRPLPEHVTEEDEKVEAVAPKPPSRKSKWWNWKLDSPTPPKTDDFDPEKGGSAQTKHQRKQVLLGPFYAGCGAALATCAYTMRQIYTQPNMFIDFVGAGVSILLEEYLMDGNATRFAMCVTLPVIFCVSIVSVNIFTIL